MATIKIESGRGIIVDGRTNPEQAPVVNFVTWNAQSLTLKKDTRFVTKAVGDVRLNQYNELTPRIRRGEVVIVEVF